MIFPRGDEYQDAVQAPAVCFADPDLRHARAETLPLGLPRPFSGGFTTTYHFTGAAGTQWAVRCFLKDIPHLERRYSALGSTNLRHRFLVESFFLREGIRIRGQYFPIIKMKWVDGESLNACVSRLLTNRAGLQNLLGSFQTLVRQMDEAGIAHGDLQHGNIMVRGSELFLIDYDDFFLPEISHLSTSRGHRNYQHCEREGQKFSSRLDRFSAIVIYLGLLALTHRRDLWDAFDNGENILFTRADFENPGETRLFRVLQDIVPLRFSMEWFREICRGSIERVPTLAEFCAGTMRPEHATQSESGSSHLPSRYYEGNYLVLDGSNKKALLEHIGERVEVITAITGFKNGETKHGKPYLFLNAGRFPRQTFCITIWSEGLEKFKSADVSPYKFIGKSISIIGVMTAYKEQPSIYIEGPKQIELISPEEKEFRLGRKPRPTPTPPTSPSGPGNSRATTISRTEADLANTVFGKTGKSEVDK